jgi:uncharacterized protein YodC (DUF2158 family)
MKWAEKLGRIWLSDIGHQAETLHCASSILLIKRIRTMEEHSEFKVGDTVRLKSGGPLMTVHRLVKMREGPDNIETVWFEGKKKETDIFKSETLTHDSGMPGVF